MKTRTIFRRSAAVAAATAMLFVHQVAQACEGCKQSVGMGDGASGDRNVNLVGLSYGLSIGFLLFMVAALLSGLGYMAYRNCRIIAARQQAALEAEDASSGYDGGFLPAASRA